MIKGICLGNVAIDCKDAAALKEFYGNLLGWEKLIAFDCHAVRSASGILFLFMEMDDYVAPVWPEETSKQQKSMHLDFQVDDLPSAIIEAETLGAVKANDQYGDNHFVTMFDPQGHPFCLCSRG
ncbi:glyoxalase/bleomycin resistance/dioxygenase family protein [Clostridia bacterium]|nr:glyoxalase/bleomycin resistance/dioxygenase family protein [Clostridia bacterium]